MLVQIIRNTCCFLNHSATILQIPVATICQERPCNHILERLLRLLHPLHPLRPDCQSCNLPGSQSILQHQSDIPCVPIAYRNGKRSPLLGLRAFRSGTNETSRKGGGVRLKEGSMGFLLYVPDLLYNKYQALHRKPTSIL